MGWTRMCTGWCVVFGMLVGCSSSDSLPSSLPSNAAQTDGGDGTEGFQLDGADGTDQTSTDGTDGFFGADSSAGFDSHDDGGDGIEGVDLADGVDGADATSAVDGGTGETNDSPLPGLEALGTPCVDNTVCNGGTCVSTDTGNVCASICSGEGCDQACPLFCPPDFLCVPVPEANGTGCVPAHAPLCRPCILDSDCAAVGPAKCASYGDGRFCATPCDATHPCPDGFVCEDVAGVQACISLSGTCGCAPGAEGATTTCFNQTDAGTCEGTRTCQNGQLSACDAAMPQAEICNNADDNCNGLTDEGCDDPTPQDSDVDGTPDEFDCKPFDGSVFPGAVESCNGKDDNCDGTTDEPGTLDCQEFFADADNDGWGSGGAACQCAASGQYKVTQAGDCNDGVGTVHPFAPETCNSVDDDCDGATDEGGVCVVEPPESEVCFPGPNNSWDVCFPLVEASSVGSADYSWPSPSSSPNASWYATPGRYIDLNAVDSSTSIAANFKLNEFAQQWKGQWAIVRPEMVAFWQSIRTALGKPLVVNSGFRSPGYNSGIDGAATYSRHMYGDAADVQTNGQTTLQAIADQCTVQNAYFIQLYTNHVHCDWRDVSLGDDYWPAAGKPTSIPSATDTPFDAGSHEPPVWADVPFDSALERRVGDILDLHARWTGFDEGTPWVSWRIHPAGSAGPVAYDREVSVGVVLDRPGRWRVDWHVGGTVHGVLEFTVVDR